MIKNIVSAIKKATKLNVYAFVAPKIEECVVYTYTPLKDNGASQQIRLDIRVISFKFDKALVIKEQIANALLEQGDGSKVNGVTSVETSGGGSMLEPNSGTTQVFQSFIITMKSEVK